MNQDAGRFGQALISQLEDEPELLINQTDGGTALAALEDGAAVAMLLIPADFSSGLMEGEAPDLELHLGPEAVRVGQLVEQAVLAAGNRLESGIRAAKLSETVADQLGLFELGSPAPEREAYREEAIERAFEAWSEAPVTLSAQPETQYQTLEGEIPQGVAQSSPGMLVMFTMFFTIGGGTVLILEREQGALRRLLVMPISKATILSGKLLGIFLGGIVQMAILILAGVLLFGVNWGQSPLGLAILALSFALTVTSLGVMMAALARTASQADALGTIVVLSLSALGGAWWPLEIAPLWMLTFGHVFPTAWAMDGFQDLITRGQRVEAVLPEAGLLLVYAAAFLLIGIWRFRYE